jgi:hypothetical protein
MAIGKAVRKAIGTACVVLAMAALLPALAAADVEPNNSVIDPEGPLLLGTHDQHGTLSASDRDDWYVLYVEGVQQLHLRVPQTFAPVCWSATLTNADGQPIASDYTSPPGTTRFFVHVSTPLNACSSGESYSFGIEPGAALVAGPGKLPVKGTREPNETLAEAGGPLAPGSWYFSTLETVNDHDWLQFYARPGAGQVDVEVVTYGGDDACHGHVLSLTGPRGTALRTRSQTRGAIEHLTVNARRGAHLFVHSFGLADGGCVGASAVVQVGPQDAIMSRAEARATCSKGRRAARSSLRRVAAGKRAIARADGSPSRAQKRRLASDRRKLKNARRLAAIYC